jgi:hypothetical protein
MVEIREEIEKMMKKSLASLGVVSIGLGGLIVLGMGLPAHATATLPASDKIYAFDCSNGAVDMQLLELQADGTATEIGTGLGTTDNLCPNQAAWDWATQQAYFVFNGNLYATDVETGVSTVIVAVTGSDPSTESDLTDSPYLAIAPNGTAWVQSDGWIGNINLTSGVVTQLTQANLRDQGAYYMYAMAYDANGGNLWAINADNTSDDSPPIPNKVVTIDQTTGSTDFDGTTLIGYQNASIQNLYTMAFDSSGRLWAIYDNQNLAELRSIDTGTGVVTDQGDVLNEGSAVNTFSIFIGSPNSGTPAATLANTGANSSIELVLVASLGITMFVAGTVALAVGRRRMS